MMHEFFRAMTPVLMANLLTVVLVYAFVQYSNLERDGRQHSANGAIYLPLAIAFVLLLAIYGLNEYGAFAVFGVFT